MKRITLAQIEVKSADLEGNTARIILAIDKAIEQKSDFIIFPELTVSGYNCGDLFEKDGFINDCRKKVHQIAEYCKNNCRNTVVIIGYPRQDGKYLKNSAAIIYDGIIVGHYDKQHLANDYHHEDKKYFKAGSENYVGYLNGIKFGVLICEDIWPGHTRNLVEELRDREVHIIFSLNFSYFTFKKHGIREDILKSYRMNIVYVNAIGVGDISKNFITYDGRSMISEHYSSTKIHTIFEAYTEQVETFDYNENLKIFALDRTMKVPVYHDKYYEIVHNLIFAQKKIFEQCYIEKAQVHISGGIDSAVVGYIAAKAMGPSKCVFITQPSKNNGDRTINNAKHLAEKLNITLEFDPIIEYIETYKRLNPDASKGQIASFEATLRKSLGFSYTHKNKSGILACGNHTENVLGWFSFGDIGSMGVYQPIGDLTKTEIFELAEHINAVEGIEIIPKNLYDGSMKPAAELEDSSEDPFDYYLMSIICEKIIRNGYTPDQIIKGLCTNYELSKKYSVEDIKKNVYEAWKRSKISVYKRGQSAPILILSNRSMGFSSRETIINFWK